MSAIDDVRSAERRVQQLVVALKFDPKGQSFVQQLRDATDEYAKAVRELKVGRTK